MARRVVLDEDVAASLVNACLLASGDLDPAEFARVHPTHWRWIANMIGDALDALPTPSGEAPRQDLSRGLTV